MTKMSNLNERPSIPQSGCQDLQLTFALNLPKRHKSSGKWEQRCRQIFAMGRTTPSGGPPNFSSPPPNFNFFLGFWPLHFANMIKPFLPKIFAEKNVKMPAEGPLTSQAPPIQFSPRTSATSFCKYDKTLFFCKILQKKNAKMPVLWDPRHAMGGTGPLCPLAAPLNRRYPTILYGYTLKLNCC